ncbi:MAG: hypothetical protein J2P17_18620 [Mycobacterium sp.]|nr:hypothetical protein [Mycobacterium sp.]
MLKKTAVTGGLLIAAAAGALVTTCSPVFATPTQLPSDHSRSWNGNENEGFNHIRLHIRNRNNNIAVARTPRERRRDLIGAPITVAPVAAG